MTTPGGRFDPAEVSGRGTSGSDAEVAAALAAARRLEGSIPATSAAAAPDLADRIMRAIAREPAPRAAGILIALRRNPSLRGVVQSVRIAWRRALGGGPLAVRGTAFAYVAAILVLTASISGVAAYTAAGALGVLPGASHAPGPSGPVFTPGPLLSPEASEHESAEPPEGSEPGDSGQPEGTQGVEPSDDHRGADGSGGSAGQTAGPSHEDGSGGGGEASPSSTRTPQPSATPKDTPKPSDTPHPSSGSGADG